MNSAFKHGQTPPAYVEDLAGNCFTLGKKLGEGGQGAVYRVSQDNDLAVKVTFSPAGNAAERVYLLPLPERINISTPISVLTGSGGYVMRLLGNMVPATGMILLQSDEPEKPPVPPHLVAMQEDDARTLMAYATSGGIRKRLQVIARAGADLARLHAAGMYYGDISPSNLFFIPGKTRHDTCWIDPDNIAFDSPAKLRPSFYTPGFGAPELLLGTGHCSSRTDNYSFAVLAHYMLTLNHPFMGKLTMDDNDDWAAEDTTSEERAYRGEFPWIFDFSDSSNASCTPLIPALVMGWDLYHCLARTFGPGRLTPSRRCSIAEIAEAAARSADASLECPACHMSWLPETIAAVSDSRFYQPDCPYCQHKAPPHICIRSHIMLHDGTTRPLGTWRREVREYAELNLPHRMLHPFSPVCHDDSVCRMTCSRDSLDICFDEDALNGELMQEDARGWQPFPLHTDYNLQVLAGRGAAQHWIYRGDIPVLLEMEYKEGLE